MSKGDVKLSPKYGVNPCLMMCPICGVNVGVALLGRLKNDAEAPRSMPDNEPCEKCKIEVEHAKSIGFVFFVARDEYEKLTGKRVPAWPFFVAMYSVDREKAKEILDETQVDMSKGACWTSETTAKMIGLTDAAAKSD